MIIKFDTDDLINGAFLFNSLRDWEEHVKHLKSQTPVHGPWNKPDTFPCIGIVGKIWDDPNGPYTVDFVFIENFEILEE